MSQKYFGKSIKELEELWEKYKQECFELRREIDRRKSNPPTTDVEFTDYITK